jgi:dTDP-N-acetylfucosamine:lipid II N-acetylfucosaminyltransferase
LGSKQSAELINEDVVYLHVAHDDKFIDYFIRRQRKYFQHLNCKYIILSDEVKLTFVKSENVQICERNDQSLRDVIDKQAVKRVYVHFFSPELYRVIADLPDDIKVYWMFWGADGTSLPQTYPDFLDPFSLQFYRNHLYDRKPQKWFNGGIFLKSTWERFFSYRKKRRAARKAFKRVDFFCHYLEEEYNYLKKKLMLRAELVDFNYCGIEDLCTVNESLYPARMHNNATVGNSGCEGNNHASLLQLLYKSGRHFEKIYCPLSYSEHPVYVNAIEKIGSTLFGDEFVPLKDFLPKQEYDKILGSCDYFFHNHYRPQAYGNIVFQLWKGGKVYMNEKSSLYRYLIKNGIVIGTISGDQITDPGDVTDNRKKLELFLSEEQMNRRYGGVLN